MGAVHYWHASALQWNSVAYTPGFPFSPAHIVYQENPDLADPRQGPVLSQGVFPSRTGGVGWQSPW